MICLASQRFPIDIQFLQIFLILIKILNLGDNFSNNIYMWVCECQLQRNNLIIFYYKIMTYRNYARL